MNPSFLSTCVRPNRPLRKPLSSPGANNASAPFSPRSATIFAPVRPAFGGVGNGSPTSMEKSPVLGLSPPALTAHFCNYCGQKGNFRCKRCKKIPYCSVMCQAEDWKAHRHTCKPVHPEPEKEKPKESTAFPAAGDGASLAEMKPSDSFKCGRVYLTDLRITKINKGGDIQASVVELYSPGRFFILAQSPEVMEALQSIGAELQKACSEPSGTLYVPCVGEVCAVQFSCDMNWYRGLVQTLAADQKVASILYIDFGNEESVSVDRIKPLPANMQPFSPCAMECRIAGVVPVFNDWSGECCLAVKQLLAGKTVTVKLLETLENGHVHVVDVLLSLGKQLSTFLIEEGYAQKEAVSAAPTEQDICAMLNASLENFKCLSDGKDDNKWAQPPEPLVQSIGDQFSVVVTHFQSPNDLIVQKVENAGAIQDLQLKLREHCSQVAIPQNFRPAPGTVCCALFSEDRQWYRVKVLAYPSEERVCVGYLDFGNSEEVDLNQLRPISTALLALPVQAMPCGLAGVQPVEESWLKDCLLALQCHLSNRILHIKILGAHEGKFLVAMTDEASDPWVNIAELLISAGYASPSPVTVGAPLQAEETTAAAEQGASPPVSQHLLWSVAKLPSDGQRVALLATVVESPGKFYCRLTSSTEHQKLTELKAQLKQHCDVNTSPFVPTLGEPCCAVFPGDGAWCRAMIKVLSDGKATVNFVDYGYSVTVEISHLRPITPELLTLPFQAVCCWLAGVEPLGSEWSSKALLWFQTLVDGEQLSAHVLTITEQGYGVELESRGMNVAASLISEHLAKASGETSKESPAKVGSITNQEGVKQNEDGVQTSIQTETGSKDRAREVQASVASEVASFPVDWKTVELPLNETFQPFIAAAISPSLFYLFDPTQVDQPKLQEVMMELSAFCSNNQNTLSAAVNTKPAPGAACCAQFSADHNWYRAVVLGVGENKVSVLYADYGNSEIVPFSRVLPIPAHLLQLPFQIVRCTLTEKEHFPAAWPEEVQQVFRAELANGVLATAQSFDGSANLLSLTLPAERGGGHLNATILDTLHAHSKSNSFPGAGSCTSEISAAAADRLQPKSLSDSQNPLEHQTGPVDATVSTKTSEPTSRSSSTASVGEDPLKKINQMEPPSLNNSDVTDPQTSSCDCQHLRKQIDNLERIMEQVMEHMNQMQLQFTLIKELERNRMH
ncbi:tudor domain-containing protein 1 isoform X1 [Kryptolebias marmoratus]|uniref:tudor domain-containing protein 1 isoform X1 n=1 Tax=Kryptolebias marmoratus TaxID=37003 RepID=UPI000D530E4F|nr:tudor domain-containing protein 1 isoform X1 [Kryptolebias marmoratus]XP_024865767.1 tudor domain-containing protein 1 isoform X1 [Kryptolebias marmoratus]